MLGVLGMSLLVGCSTTVSSVLSSHKVFADSPLVEEGIVTIDVQPRGARMAVCLRVDPRFSEQSCSRASYVIRDGWEFF